MSRAKFENVVLASFYIIVSLMIFVVVFVNSHHIVSGSSTLALTKIGAYGLPVTILSFGLMYALRAKDDSSKSESLEFEKSLIQELNRIGNVVTELTEEVRRIGSTLESSQSSLKKNRK